MRLNESLAAPLQKCDFSQPKKSVAVCLLAFVKTNRSSQTILCDCNICLLHNNVEQIIVSKSVEFDFKTFQ